MKETMLRLLVKLKMPAMVLKMVSLRLLISRAGSQNISARWNSETLQLLNETQISIAGTTTIGTGIGVTTILDEDDMASNSATALASQQSIKAYVDAQITAEDLDFGGDSGTGSV